MARCQSPSELVNTVERLLLASLHRIALLHSGSQHNLLDLDKSLVTPQCDFQENTKLNTSTEHMNKSAAFVLMDN